MDERAEDYIIFVATTVAIRPDDGALAYAFRIAGVC